MIEHASVAFFEQQFQRQLGAADPAHRQLNPFETASLPYLAGEMLDYGCGLGNLAVAAAERGCKVHALDGSPAAIRHLSERATAMSLALQAEMADLRHYSLTQSFDTVVCIGLLMFFDCATAQRVLSELQSHVRPGGTMVLNVLIEGTTYLDMFDANGYCLFVPEAIMDRFTGWQTLHAEHAEFAAPGQTLKRFFTLIARKPAAA